MIRQAFFLIGLLFAFQGTAETLGPSTFPAGKQETASQETFSPAWTLTLPPLDAGEKAKFSRLIKVTPMVVGIGRFLDEPIAIPKAFWRRLKDGRWQARFSIISPGAAGVRLRLRTRLSGTVWRFANPSLKKVYGPFLPEAEEPFWSPVSFGEEALAEVVLPPEASPEDRPFEVLGISHLFAHPLSLEKDLRDIGASGDCNVDVMCHPQWRDTAEAVAKYVFSDNLGRSFLCTGTLLNNKRHDFRPYFLTANHCISKINEASSLHTYWFFERATCGGPDPTSVTERTGGASLLNHGQDSDFSILKLRDDPPGGVFFAGWTSDPVSPQTPIAGIHHPSGDLKKISLGEVEGFANYLRPLNPSGNHIRVRWHEGTTEPGSSGSGLFLDHGHYLAGTLHGGGASCDTPDEPDYYGRFDLDYPFLSPWLDPDGVPVADNGGVMSGHVDKDAWRYYRIFAEDRLKVELFDLTGDADLYVKQGNAPGFSEYDCRPYEGDATPETCLFDHAQGEWFIAVHGFKAASFKLRITAFPKRGMWWDPQRSGHGIDLQRAGDILFVTWFTYEDDGTPTWYLASAPFANPWNASLDRYTWNGTSATPTTVGNLTMTFTDPTHATFSWTLNGRRGSEPFEYFLVDPVSPSSNHTGHWFPPGEPGYGLTLNMQGPFEFGVLYFYDNMGQPRWVLGSKANLTDPVIPMDSYLGFCPDCPWAPTTHAPAGTITRSFSDATHGTLSTDIHLPAPLSGDWVRHNVPIMPLSDPP